MKGTLGGISMASAPAVTTEPAAIFVEYPLCSIWGTAMDPMAATPATLTPLTAPKTVQAPMEAMASPPGSQDSHLVATLNRSPPIGLFPST